LSVAEGTVPIIGAGRPTVRGAHDERASPGDHRSWSGNYPAEHDLVQDRNFVRAFTSDYRVFQSPSTPDPGVTRPGALGSVGCVVRVARDVAKSEYSTIEET
jgi:hypothetical protein